MIISPYCMKDIFHEIRLKAKRKTSLMMKGIKYKPPIINYQEMKVLTIKTSQANKKGFPDLNQWIRIIGLMTEQERTDFSKYQLGIIFEKPY